MLLALLLCGTLDCALQLMPVDTTARFVECHLQLQFDQYEAASEAVYKILLRHTAAVQLISCDEAYLDVSELGDPLAIATAIRAEVCAAGCC